jgi:hypothetical protein
MEAVGELRITPVFWKIAITKPPNLIAFFGVYSTVILILDVDSTMSLNHSRLVLIEDANPSTPTSDIMKL